MSYHTNTGIDGAFDYILEKFHNQYHVTVVKDGLVQAVLMRRSERKIVVALIRSYVSEYRPDTRVHYLTLHSSVVAARNRAKDCPSSTWTYIRVEEAP